MNTNATHDQKVRDNLLAANQTEPYSAIMLREISDRMKLQAESLLAISVKMEANSVESIDVLNSLEFRKNGVKKVAAFVRGAEDAWYNSQVTSQIED